MHPKLIEPDEFVFCQVVWICRYGLIVVVCHKKVWINDEEQIVVAMVWGAGNGLAALGHSLAY